MKNLLVKILPLLAIVIAAPAFAGTNDEYSVGEASALRNRSNGRVNHSEYGHRHERAANRRERVIIVTDRYYSPRGNRQEVRREYRGYHKYRGDRNSYFHR